MKLSHFLLALFLAAVWGFNFVFIKIGLTEMPPLLLASTRFFLSSLPAIFFIKPPSVPFRLVILYSLFMYVLQFSLFFIGLDEGMPVSVASLLLQLQVFFTLLFAVLFFREKLHKWQVIGALISFVGIALLTMHFGDQFTLFGFLLLIGAAISWGLGNVVSKKMEKINIASLVVWGSFLAWPPLLVLSFIMEGPTVIIHSLTHLSSHGIGAILYTSYLATFFAFITWSWLLSRYPLSTVAPFTLLTPLFGIISAVVILKEPLEGWKATAALFMMIGLVVNLIGDHSHEKNIS